MDKKVLFEALNTELAKENIDLEIICVGGFVLEYYNLRGTQDVDALYHLRKGIEDDVECIEIHLGEDDPLKELKKELPDIADFEKRYKQEVGG